MKKLSFFLMAMLMSVMSFAAEATATISFANKAQRTVYTTSQQVWEQNGIVVTNDKASSTTNVGDYANPARFYKNSKVTIQCTLGNIKKIEITGWGDSKYNVWATSIGSEATASGSSVIITPTAVSDTYVANMTGGQARAGQMVVTYEVSDEGFVATPAIEGEQYFKESATVSMKAAEGLKVYYTLDGTEPTTASTEYAAPFEVTETTTVKAIAHDGENASEVVTVVFKKMEVLTPSEAVALCTTTESADKYIIRGYVTKIATAYDASYNNITFWLADEADGGEILQAYRAVPVTENDKTVAEGAYVEIVGKLVLFGSSKTPEVPAGGTYTIIPAPVVNHTITVSANPAEGGVVTGGGEFEETDEITVEAVANDGYEFVNWTENEVEVSTDAEYTFAVLADRALVANFKKAAPATETVYFINAKKWAKVNVYAWTTDPNASWPGAAATKEAEQIAGYDVYSFTANAGQYANVIFNDGTSQTPDLVWTAGKYYVVDMGWLTKEEAETELAAPLPEVWTIVGAAGLMGKDWDLNAAENAMTKQGDGTYKLVKTGITIVAGTYEYKAAKDHGWTVAVPQDGNQKLTISTSGTYDVTFVLDVTAKKLTATATLKQAAVVIPTIVIAGDMNGWNQTKDKFTMSADSLTATFKATLAVKNYGFKMIVGGAWHSDGKTITRAANSTKFTGANSNTNSTLKADIAGEYLFTWEYATKTLTVTYPALPVKYNVTVTAEHGTVTGAGEYEEGTEATLTAIPAEGYEFVNWTKGEDEVSTENPYTFTVSADVDLVANFKVAEPETITWELNGGKLPLVGPTNAELWEMFKPYYNTYYGLARADQPIDKVTTFASAYMQKIMTDPESEYKWLGDYVLEVAASQGLTLPTDMASANEGAWRWAVHAFFNANEGQYGATGADFTEAGKSENWVNVYPDAQEVVVPTEPVTEDYVLPTPVKEGCKFVGWYDNAEGTGEAMTVLPAGWAGTLYAIWKQGTTTALENIAVEGKAVKAIVNGQLIIIKNGVQYNAQGQVVK